MFNDDYPHSGVRIFLSSQALHQDGDFRLYFLLQGCMNNITFGDEGCGYYETVAGGAGAVSVTNIYLMFLVLNAQPISLPSI